MTRYKLIISTVLLSLTVIASYAIPVARYQGTGFISSLKIPMRFASWQGRDITDQLNLDFDKDWNKFISEASITQYLNDRGEKLQFIILDAGNFHHPNVCFTAAGFEIEELGITNIKLPGRTIQARTLMTTKENESNLSLYWIIIDKEITDKWIEQKIKQLYFSLFNRQRVGLMVRLDVPSKREDIQKSLIVAQKFLTEISEEFDEEQANYILGDYTINYN